MALVRIRQARAGSDQSIDAVPLFIYNRQTRLSLVDNQSDVTKPTDLVQGTLDLLILRTIATESLHGWAIAQRIQLLSRDVLRINQGSLYPALQRLERQGWITADWGVSETNRRARFYRLTSAGRRRLEQERADWERLSAAISLVMRTA
jgi:PadR family transcriptional regulator, regulatory protein PadR